MRTPYTQEYYQRNKEAINKRNLLWYHANRHCFERSQMKTRYGITLEGYEELLKRQNGVCAICLKEETMKIRGKVKKLAVDHDHKTLKVRGLLCHSCNLAIGKLYDDPAVLFRAYQYLMRG